MCRGEKQMRKLLIGLYKNLLHDFFLKVHSAEGLVNNRTVGKELFRFDVLSKNA